MCVKMSSFLFHKISCSAVGKKSHQYIVTGQTVIGLELLLKLLIGLQINICPLSGWFVRIRKRLTYLRTKKMVSSHNCGVCIFNVSLWEIAKKRRCWKVSTKGEIKKGRHPFVSVWDLFNLCGRKCIIIKCICAYVLDNKSGSRGEKSNHSL